MNKLMNYYMNYAKGKNNNVCLDAVLVPLSWVAYGAALFMDVLRKYGLAKTEEPPLPVISVRSKPPSRSILMPTAACPLPEAGVTIITQSVFHGQGCTPVR